MTDTEKVSEQYRTVIDDLITATNRGKALAPARRSLAGIRTADVPAGPIREAHLALAKAGRRAEPGPSEDPRQNTLAEIGDFVATAMWVEYLLREHEEPRRSVPHASRGRPSGHRHRASVRQSA